MMREEEALSDGWSKGGREGGRDADVLMGEGTLDGHISVAIKYHRWNSIVCKRRSQRGQSEIFSGSSGPIDIISDGRRMREGALDGGGGGGRGGGAGSLKKDWQFNRMTDERSTCCCVAYDNQ